MPPKPKSLSISKPSKKTSKTKEVEKPKKQAMPETPKQKKKPPSPKGPADVTLTFVPGQEIKWNQLGKWLDGKILSVNIGPDLGVLYRIEGALIYLAEDKIRTR